MRLNEIVFNEARPIDGYGPGFFRVAGQVVEGNVFVSPQGVVPWDGYGDTAALIRARDTLDVLFIGTGAEVAHVPADFRSLLEEAGLGVESMASPAACRTYNILLSEGRRVGVALIAV